jgi:glycosyltransferase involved in cell wall biosynthesis
LLHVHGVFWPATIAAIVARLYRKPLVLKMTRSGDDDPAALVSLRQQRGLLGWARFLPLKRANTVIALNQPMADDFLRVGLPQNRLRLWSNAVDTDEFRPPAPEERQTARAELSFRGREVLFPGGLLPHKGLATVIEACRDLLALFPELRLHVLGPCDPLDREVDANYVTHIRNLIDHDARVGSMVDFVGRVPSDRVRRYYWACDAFVLPSEREGQPNALLEAMACGVPCIASAIPGIEDMGLPEDLVAMISPGDHVALAQSLFRLLSTGQTLDLAQRRRALVVERFSMAGLAERYEELYRDLIDRYE